MSEYRYEYELGKAAKILVEELFKIKPGETFVITADTESNKRVVDATARATFAAGGKPMVIWTASPLGVGKAADAMLPVESLGGALAGADAWIEYNNQWLLYSTPFDKAMANNPKLRYQNACGMNEDMMVRLIGRVDFPTLEEFMKCLRDMTINAKQVHITTPAGCDVTFNNVAGRFISLSVGYADTPGAHMQPGQIAWSPDLETINGILVFDGSIVPPFTTVLKEPVALHIKNGTIVKLEGGQEALVYEQWLKSFNHPQMLKLAHVCYGVHPNARLTGDIVEDERIWGATEWGLGNIGPFLIPPKGISGPSHSDGICLNSSMWLDNIQILEEGRFIEAKLKEIAKKLGKE